MKHNKINVLYSIVVIFKIVAGFVLSNILIREKLRVVIILSAQRSGSTLLKALLSEAPEIKHINEYDFQHIHSNKYIAYFDIWKINPRWNAIILLKMPPNFDNYKDYPITPSIPTISFKTITLIRNPIDTLISIEKAHKKFGNIIRPHLLIQYWTTTYNNLLVLNSSKTNKIVHYEDLVNHPVENTKILFDFIGAKMDKGVEQYRAPISGWKWKKDDGGELIKKLKVLNVNKDYRADEQLIVQILSSKNVTKLVENYKIKMPL